MRVLVVGDGKMGRAVEAIARARGHDVAAVLGRAAVQQGALQRDRLAGIDAAVEFTAPASAAGNLERLVQAGVPVVTGTTGWSAELPRLTALVERTGGALLHAANFSPGVHLFLRVAREMARRFRPLGAFGAFIVEEHHGEKRDAPSGTALQLQRGLREADPGRDFPVTAIRGGAVPGTHTLVYDAPRERLELRHMARDRAIFAQGALDAAEWLVGRRGVYTYEQMLFGDDA